MSWLATQDVRMLVVHKQRVMPTSPAAGALTILLRDMRAPAHNTPPLRPWPVGPRP